MEKQIRNRCTLLYDFICEHLNNGLKLLPSPSHKYEISIRAEHNNIYSSSIIEKI